MRSIWTTFHACGTVVVLNAMQEETVEKVAKAQAADFEAQVAAGLKAGTQEEATDTNMIGARNYGRWEIKYELKQPYIDPDFAVRNPLSAFCAKTAHGLLTGRFRGVNRATRSCSRA